jgi:Cys-tRNA(Pro)/Cys-tRNA(Cys) deacylase
MHKTNAVRILESLNVPYKIYEYEVDENDLSGMSVAKKINVPLENVFKTLITRNERNEILVFCLPVNQELALKKAARVSNSKKIEMLKMNELLSVTGYIRGGCSPIGMKKNFPVYIENTAQILDKIYISAGIRGMQIEISFENLNKILSLHLVDVIKSQ